MSREQVLLMLGFLVVVFMAGYAARAARSYLRRLRRSRRHGHGRLFYAGRRVSVPDEEEAEAPPAIRPSFDSQRLEADLERLGAHVEALRALFAEQQAMCGAARTDLARATDSFRMSVEQTQVLTKTLTDRLDAAQRLQADFEQMLVRLRKRGKAGEQAAVLPFKVRQRRMTEQK